MIFACWNGDICIEWQRTAKIRRSIAVPGEFLNSRGSTYIAATLTRIIRVINDPILGSVWGFKKTIVGGPNTPFSD